MEEEAAIFIFFIEVFFKCFEASHHPSEVASVLHVMAGACGCGYVCPLSSPLESSVQVQVKLAKISKKETSPFHSSSSFR